MPHAVVAIPVRNEAERIEACLAALLRQRDRCGSQVPASAYSLVVFANNCTDDTAERARRWAERAGRDVRVVEEESPRSRAHAGWARRRAMDLAAAELDERGASDGVLLTTDGDTLVSPTWIDATLAAFAAGADAVAGYVDVHPLEMTALGAELLARSRLEDDYLRLCAEIGARCDPRPHDPWPNHRIASGASLAVTLAAYRAIGGLPEVETGEDGALARALEAASFRVRHALDVYVSTSARFDGRALGGTADTLRERHARVDLPCGDDIEPAFVVLRRALLRGRLRASTPPDRPGTPSRFEELWASAVARDPSLTAPHPLRPRELPRQIRRAQRILQERGGPHA